MWRRRAQTAAVAGSSCQTDVNRSRDRNPDCTAACATAALVYKDELMARLFWFVAIGGLYLLHQDVWFWREARPLAFGFLPIGLAYHAVFCLAVAVLMWGLTRHAWPAHLEQASDGDRTQPGLDRGASR